MRFSIISNSLFLAIAVAAAPTGARASTFTIDTDADTTDAFPGDGVCADASGFCSLRAAFAEEAALGTGILVADGAAPGSIALGYTLVVATDVMVHDLDILAPCDQPAFDVRAGGLQLANVDLSGTCAGGYGTAVTLFEGGYLELFGVTLSGFDGLRSAITAFDAYVGLTDTVMQHNRRPTDEMGRPEYGRGGAITVSGGTLAVAASLFLENEANRGAAIFAIDTEVSIGAGTRFEMNTAAVAGGGLSTEGGTVAVSDTYFLGNDALESDGSAGIFFSPATFTRCSFFGNATGRLGTLAFIHPSSVVASTFIANYSADTGSAIATWDVAEVVNTTFLFNEVGVSGQGVFAVGYGDLSEVRMGNSLLAHNRNTSGDADCSVEVTSLGHNLVSRAGEDLLTPLCTGFSTEIGDRTGTSRNPLRLHLAGFGVWTPSPYSLPSVRLYRASPAVESGDPSLCPGFDQDGYGPVDADRDGTATCDIGSYEWGAR